MSFEYKGPGYYVSRDGTKCLVGESARNPDCLVGVYYHKNETHYVKSWSKQKGRYNREAAFISEYDLVGPWVDPPKPREIWFVETEKGELSLIPEKSEIDARGVQKTLDRVNRRNSPHKIIKFVEIIEE